MDMSELQSQVADDAIDTVVVGFTDHYGRTLGKRFDAGFFCESVGEGTHACDYLLTVDMEMDPVEGSQTRSRSTPLPAPGARFSLDSRKMATCQK